MGYSRNNYNKIRGQLEERRMAAEAAADARRAEIGSKYPEIGEIDRALQSTGLKILQSAMQGREGLAERVAKLRREVEELREARRLLLAANGYPEDELEPRYQCSECSDTGFSDGKMCACFKSALVMAGYESSGFGALLEKQGFNNFSLSYYADDRENYENMRYILDVAKKYAENFSGKGDSNLLFIGGTGLGKTHLASAAAKRIIERGFDVFYVSAQNITDEFGDERFGRGDADTTRYFNTDLLVIDDLGTEANNQFSVSCVYNVINSRLNCAKATLINTNLSVRELQSRYSDRIVSRLLGEYMVLIFKGRDIRQQKLTQKI